MQRSILCVPVLLLLFFSSAYSQSDYRDSLESVLKSATEANQVTTLLALNKHLERSEPKLALQYAYDALAISEELNNQKLIANALEHQAISFLNFSNFDSALICINRAVKILEELKDHSRDGEIQNLWGNFYVDQGQFDTAKSHYLNSLKVHEANKNLNGISTAYNNLGYVHSRQGDYDSSNLYHYKSLDLNKKLGEHNSIGYSYYNLGVNFDMSGDFDRSLESFIAGLNIFDSIGNTRMIGSSYNSLGIIYTGQGQYEKALEYHKKNLSMKIKAGENRSVGFSYANIGSLYEKLNQYDTALSYHLKSLEIRKDLGDKFSLAATYHNLGRAYHKAGQLQESKYYYEQAVPLMEEMGNNRGLTSVTMGIGNLSLELKDYNTALKYSKQAEKLAKAMKAKELQKESYELLALIYEETQNYKLANSYRKQYQVLKDSLYNAEKDEIIAKITNQFETAKKDQELAEQTLLMDKQESNLGQQRLLIFVLITILVASLIIGLLLFNRYKLRQKNKSLVRENESIKVERNLKLRQKADDIINYFATSLYGKNSVDEILWDVVNNCIAQLGFKDCVIYLVDFEKQTLIQKAAYGQKSHISDQVLSPIEIPFGEGIVGHVAKTGVAEIVNNTSKDSRYIIDDEARLSEIAVPIFQHDQVIGVIDSEHPETDFYDDFHLQALTTIASICGSKISQTQADEEAAKAKIAKLEAEQIKALDQLKSQFFANISHEFRTPLNLILGPLRKLREELSEEDLLMMERNAWKLLNLVNQLLDLAKLEVGKLQLSERNIDLNEHLRLSASHFSSMAQARGVNYIIEIPEEVLPVSIDEDKLDKVLYNLLSNAIKFSNSGDQVTIVSSVITPNQLKIEVSDTGVGIKQVDQSRIFERFYQVDGTQTRRHEGTGIGLALSKEITELMGGTIKCVSEQSKGSTFTVTIPLNLVDPTEIEETASELNKYVSQQKGTPQEADHEIQEGLPVVLIAEDNNDLRKYMTDHLLKNYNVLATANGKDGLKVSLEKIPDLIISDVMMPEMDGIELTKAIRSNEATSHIPTILLTARDDKATKNLGFETGIDQYMAKPFELEELETRVSNLIKQRDRLKDKYSTEIYLRPTDVEIEDAEGAFIQKALVVIEEYMSDDQFTVEQFQKELGLSRMQLHRKLKALTNQSASEFIRSIRLERASQLLKSEQSNVTEVAYQVGFSHLSYFAKCFKEKFGKSPSDFQKDQQS